MPGDNRRYLQTKRATQAEETRQRIVDAALNLHRTVGPARTSMSAVADHAGVSRPTLYAHFSSEAGLFEASTILWLRRDPSPDHSLWLEIEDPRDRVEFALTQLYEHYDRDPQLTENVLRDMHDVPSMLEFDVPGVEAGSAAKTEILVVGFENDDDVVRTRRRAACRVALSFDTFRLLSRQGQDIAASVDLMTDMVVRAP